jgi:hypothetical protein
MLGNLVVRIYPTDKAQPVMVYYGEPHTLWKHLKGIVPEWNVPTIPEEFRYRTAFARGTVSEAYQLPEEEFNVNWRTAEKGIVLAGIHPLEGSEDYFMVLQEDSVACWGQEPVTLFLDKLMAKTTGMFAQRNPERGWDDMLRPRENLSIEF